MYTEQHSNLHLIKLFKQSDKDRHCGYTYLVTSGAMSHTAFRTKAGLREFLRQSGLKLGKRSSWLRGITLVGSYSRTAYLDDSATWESMRASGQYEEIPVLSNGQYTVGLLERRVNGNEIHYLNVNVRTRETLPYRWN